MNDEDKKLFEGDTTHDFLTDFLRVDGALEAIQMFVQIALVKAAGISLTEGIHDKEEAAKKAIELVSRHMKKLL